jgi:hypothetical protein
MRSTLDGVFEWTGRVELDDPIVDRDGPDAHSGPNRVSLNEARANFARFGASTERDKAHARAPRPEEQPAS